MGRPVAIKYFDLENLTLEHRNEALRRITQSLRAAGRVRHPIFAEIFDYDLSDPVHPWFAMEFIEGETLREFLNQHVPLKPTAVLRILRQLAEGLDVAHVNGVIHRDFNPSNVMLTAESRIPRIVDLGIARVIDMSHRTPVCFGGAGTPPYEAPEQQMGLPVDGRADQFALALVAAEWLTGAKASDVLAWTTSDQLGRTCLPSRCGSVLRRALSWVPAGRYSTCVEFVDQLEAACRWRPMSWRWFSGFKLATVCVALLSLKGPSVLRRFDPVAPISPGLAALPQAPDKARRSSLVRKAGAPSQPPPDSSAIASDATPQESMSPARSKPLKEFSFGPNDTAVATSQDVYLPQISFGGAFLPESGRLPDWLSSSTLPTLVAPRDHQPAPPLLEPVDRRIQVADTKTAALKKARGLYGAGLIREALAILQQLQPLTPEAGIYSDRGVCHLALGEYQRALTEFNEAFKLTPSNALYYLHRGMTHYWMAYNRDQRLLTTENATMGVTILMANKRPGPTSEAAVNEYRLAIFDTTKALDLRPELAEANNIRGLAYTETGNYARAIAEFDRAIQLRTSSAAYRLNRGAAYYRRSEPEPGDLRMAVADATDAIRLRTTYAMAFNLRGLAYVRLQKYPQAVSDFKKAAANDRKNVEYYDNLESASIAAGDKHEAEAARREREKLKKKT